MISYGLRFPNNLPGPDFVFGFMKRHRELTIGSASLLRRTKAASPQIVNEFFDRFEKVAARVPPENIFHYNETNLRDDPGVKKAIFQRGVKYTEQVRDSKKTCLHYVLWISSRPDFAPLCCLQGGQCV